MIRAHSFYLVNDILELNQSSQKSFFNTKSPLPDIIESEE